MRFAPRINSARLWWEWQDRIWFDRYVASHLPPCDLFCGLSGSALHTGRIARSHGAKYVCDRGSSHIRFQDRILRQEYDRQGNPFCGIDPRIMRREEEYEAADAIVVPSTFVLNSFIEAGFDQILPVRKTQRRRVSGVVRRQCLREKWHSLLVKRVSTTPVQHKASHIGRFYFARSRGAN